MDLGDGPPDRVLEASRDTSSGSPAGPGRAGPGSPGENFREISRAGPGRAGRPGRAGPGRAGPPGAARAPPLGASPGAPFWGLQELLVLLFPISRPPEGGVPGNPPGNPPRAPPRGGARAGPGRPRGAQKVHIFLGI